MNYSDIVKNLDKHYFIDNNIGNNVYKIVNFNNLETFDELNEWNNNNFKRINELIKKAGIHIKTKKIIVNNYQTVHDEICNDLNEKSYSIEILIKYKNNILLNKILSTNDFNYGTFDENKKKVSTICKKTIRQYKLLLAYLYDVHNKKN